MNIDQRLLTNSVFSTIIDQAEALLILLDHELNIVSINKTTISTLKCDPILDIGMNIAQFSEKHDLSILKQVNLTTLQNACTNSILHLQHTLEKSIKNLFLSWKVIILEQHLSFLLVGYNNNIDERFQQKLQELHEYYENIIAVMPGHVYWQDKNGRYLGCNNEQAQACELASPKDIVNKTLNELPCYKKKSTNLSLLQQINEEILKTKETQSVEEVCYFDDGEERTYLSKKHPLRDKHGEIIGIIGVSLDISSLKEKERNLHLAKEQAEHANKIKSDFIAYMSHDLRTPLNGIFGAIQVLLMSPHNPEQKSLFYSIRQAANNLLFLIDDVLSFSKLESSSVIIHNEPCDLQLLISDIVSLIHFDAIQKKIKIIISYCDLVPTKIISDANIIRRILINLLSNALKFTDFGHILIAVDLVSTKDDHSIIQIAVEDTGIGISEDKIDFIFDRFTKLNPSYNNRYPGTGLGLTIAKQLTEKLGGSIKVNSQLGWGSTFYCILPVKLQKTFQATETWNTLYKNIRILIVDDYIVRAQHMLKHIRNSQNEFCNSKSVLNKLKQSQQENNIFQILLIDDELMHCPTLTIIESIKNDPIYENILIIVLAGTQTNNLQLEKFKKAGSFAYFSKPIHPKIFLHELKNVWTSWNKQITNKNNLHKQLKVLLVEDDTISKNTVTFMLESLHCNVEIASTGAQALELISYNTYDLIFMDIGLPDTSGLEVTKIIFANDPNFHKNTKIIGLTAHANASYQQECIKAGMNFFIPKPLMFNDLKKAVKKIFLQKTKALSKQT